MVEGRILELVYGKRVGFLCTIRGTAEEMKSHIKGSWARRIVAIQALRMELGDEAGSLVPTNRGGVRFLKVFP